MTAYLRCKGHRIRLDKTAVMGILNVTPDSFYDGKRYKDVRNAVKRALEMEADGADIIDIGGESTRPGSESVSVGEELDLVIPVIKRLKGKLSIPISIDTYKPQVAERALEHGAELVNDIFALRREGMAEVVSGADVPVVLMHMSGTPKTMQKNPVYADVVSEIKSFFKERVRFAVSCGISKEKIILDPGIGFGKTTQNNLQIIRDLKKFQDLRYPILVGPSRKSFIGDTLGLEPDERLEGTIASVILSVVNGAAIVRVHDVKENVRAIRMVESLLKVPE